MHTKTQGHTFIQVTVPTSHTDKNTHAYTHTHTLTACFRCVIAVLFGTVAAGESVLETQSRLRLAKQIITSLH